MNVSVSNDSAPGRLAGNVDRSGEPQAARGRLLRPAAAPVGCWRDHAGGAHQYQIYDPLTARADPLRPGRVIRDPFPNNIIPKNRFMNPDGSYKNPSFGMYQAMVPEPNQNFISPTQQPTTTTTAPRNRTSRTTRRRAFAWITTNPPIAASSFEAMATSLRSPRCRIGPTTRRTQVRGVA